MTEHITIPITFTSTALEEIHRLKTLENQDKNYLRVGVKGGGCAGFSYVLEFDKAGENDDILDYHGVQIVINKTQSLYLYGITIDFKKGLDNRGFIFDNPNATSTCGCGTSFSA